MTDVWETKEQFETFARDQIGPLSAKAGYTGQPLITYFEIHNHLSAR